METDEGLVFPDALDEFVYRGVRARFTGIEASGNLRLLGTDGFSRPADGSTLDLEWRADLVRATNTDTGEPLPRISPARVGATLAYGNGPWTRAPGLRPLRGAATACRASARARPMPTRCGMPRSPTA